MLRNNDNFLKKYKDFQSAKLWLNTPVLIIIKKKLKTESVRGYLSLTLRIFASTPTVKCWKGSKRGCSQQYVRKLLQFKYSATAWCSHGGVA